MLTCTEIAYKMHFDDCMCFGNDTLLIKGPVCQTGLFRFVWYDILFTKYLQNMTCLAEQ